LCSSPLYAFCLRRVAHAESEEPALVGVAARLAELPQRSRRRWTRVLMLYAAVVILFTAVPFGDAVLETGALVGISPRTCCSSGSCPSPPRCPSSSSRPRF
jgi:hypothetical protein